jgi:hypothetical protein
MGTLVPFTNPQGAGQLPAALGRPFDATGVLVPRHETPPSRSALWAQAGAPLAAHLAQVCTWRPDRREVDWRIGDYSFLALDFDIAPGAGAFIQFWSEPEEPRVLIEVCSGARDGALLRHLTRRRQDELRDRGFEISGAAGNFCKAVVVDSPVATESLAREALGIACRVLGYDGTTDLHYRLHLGSRLVVKPTHTGINARELACLLRDWGCRAEPYIHPDTGQPSAEMLLCEYGGYPFSALLLRGASPEPTHKAVVCFRRYLTDKSLPLAQIANVVSAGLIGIQASIDGDGDLQFDQVVLLEGGISAASLRAHLNLWKANLDSIGGIIEKAG